MISPAGEVPDLPMSRSKDPRGRPSIGQPEMVWGPHPWPDRCHPGARAGRTTVLRSRGCAHSNIDRHRVFFGRADEIKALAELVRSAAEGVALLMAGPSGGGRAPRSSPD